MDYKLRFTDSTKLPFVVKEYTTNGPATPSSPVPLHPQAVSANTSLVLLGCGMFDYGQPIQEDLLHILENFASPTEPAYPIEGQLWYNNSQTSPSLRVFTKNGWKSIPLSGMMSGALDMSNNAIINLADPVAPADALNLRTADGRYLALTGGTMSGNIVLTGASKITVAAAPTAAMDLTNKQYVDQAIAAAVTGGVTDYVKKSGDTMSGTLHVAFGDVDVQTGKVLTKGLISSDNVTITGALTILDLAGTMSVGKTIAFKDATGQIQMSGGGIHGLATPTDPNDAATKAYVDAHAGTGGGDGVVTGGALNPITGVLTLDRSQGLPIVTIAGNFANKVHVHSASEVNISTNPSYWDSFVREQVYGTGAFPETRLNDLISLFDRQIFLMRTPPVRMIATNLTGTPIITLPDDYMVEAQELSVYRNGIRLVADPRGQWFMEPTPTPSVATPTGLLNATPYTLGLTVNGVVQPVVTITPPGPAPQTYSDLVTSLNTAFVANSIPVVANLLGSTLCMVTTNTGTNTSIRVTSGNLITSLTGTTTPAFSDGTATYGFSERGTPFQTSNTIQINAPALTTSEVIEIIFGQRT